MVILIVIIILFMLLVALSLCGAASHADDEFERMFDEYMKEQEKENE
jgi:hypothetical protein